MIDHFCFLIQNLNDQSMGRSIILFSYIVLSLYCFGASMLDYFGIYEAWKLVGEEEFATFHTFQGNRIIAIFVIPCAAMTLVGLAAAIFPVKNINRLWLWLSLVGIAFVWILSFSIQIPIQLILNTRKDMQLLDELLYTNWFRYLASVFQLVFILAILWKLVYAKQQQLRA
jgi:hypothetical protein